MPADRELVLTRLIDAPRDKVYRAWTDPELLKQWFAPKPYTTPVVEIDGARYVMVTQSAAALRRGDLGQVVMSLADRRHEIMNAFDFLLTGV